MAVHQIEATDCTVKIEWPKQTFDHINTLRHLQSEAANYLDRSSIFYGQEPKFVAEFTTNSRYALQNADQIISGAHLRSTALVKGMLPYWTSALENVIGQSLMNYLTLCNYQILRNVIYFFGYKPLHEKYFPREYVEWFNVRDSREALRQIFPLKEKVCSAKVFQISNKEIEGGAYFWGPRSELLYYANRRSGDAIKGTWFDKYFIPQNELRLLRKKSEEIVQYDETQLGIIKVVDLDGTEIA